MTFSDRTSQFTNVMDAMIAAGGRIYYFVVDYNAKHPFWDKVLYAFKQMFMIAGDQLLIVDVPLQYANKSEFAGINALIDRFCFECQGIIKHVNPDGSDSPIYQHAGIFIDGCSEGTLPYKDKALAEGKIIVGADDVISDFWECPFLTKSGIRKPLISICIPTYNRSKSLKITLDSIISQPEFKQGLVEIVISDNCSSDETELIVKSYAEKYEMIKYFRNGVNVTGANFNLALVRAKGLLRKLNNDTCIIYDNGLSYLCEMAMKYAYIKPLMYFGNVPDTVGNGENILLRHQFLMKETFHITWIASFAIWDEDCIGIENEYIEGEQFWHVRKMMELLEKRKAVAACDKMIMGAMIDDKHYSGQWLWDVFHDDFFDIVGGYLSQQDREMIEMDLLFNHFGLVKRAHELYPNSLKLDDDFDDVMAEHYLDKPYWKDYIRIFGGRDRNKN